VVQPNFGSLQRRVFGELEPEVVARMGWAARDPKQKYSPCHVIHILIIFHITGIM
jgi:hypothetical protein